LSLLKIEKDFVTESSGVIHKKVGPPLNQSAKGIERSEQIKARNKKERDGPLFIE